MVELKATGIKMAAATSDPRADEMCVKVIGECIDDAANPSIGGNHSTV